MTDVDVLIIGGGPAGLSVAASLPADVSAVLLHQDAEIGKPVRTSGGTWVRDMAALGIPEHLYQVINRLDFFSDAKEAVFDQLADQMAVLDITGSYQYLASLVGAACDIRTGTSLHDIRFEAGRYHAVARSRDGAEVRLRARWVVDASGWKMAALEKLGLAQKPTRTGVGFEYEFPRGSFQHDRAVLFVGSAALTGYGWIFPTPGARLRLGIGVIHPDTDLSPRGVMQAFKGSGAADRFGLSIPDEAETHAGVIPSVAYAPELVFGNLMRVGDSANMATPTVGEGIRIAITEGRALGAALGQAIHGNRRPLAMWERAATRHYSRNYRFGLMMNHRIAGYTPERWDKSVARLARLGEAEMVAAVRSEFAPRMVARTIALSLLAKFLPPR
ncbi:MAG: NAD(P)/FAD-dependent oxidoreductase [Pseudomonadota bacterium]